MEQNEQDLGQHDAKVSDFFVNVATAIGGAVSPKLNPVVEHVAQLFKSGVRTPVLRRPDDYGMEYEDIFFQSMDGVPLEAWYIPAESNKLLIINHPLTCNRYGLAGHLPPYNLLFGGFEVNFLPELKALHDAGYNILTYDFRNCGQSADANGGITGLGLLECRDVVGSVRYAKSRKDLASMTTGLFSRCLGGNATVVAMSKWPEEFEHIQALVLLNVVSTRTFAEKIAEHLYADPQKAVEDLDRRIRHLTGFRVDEMTPRPYAKDIKVPTLMAQLRRDFLTHAEKDGNEIFSALGAEEKELLWIEESNQRFYAYNHFGQHPEPLIGWFDRYMGGKETGVIANRRKMKLDFSKESRPTH